MLYLSTVLMLKINSFEFLKTFYFFVNLYNTMDCVYIKVNYILKYLIPMYLNQRYNLQGMNTKIVL